MARNRTFGQKVGAGFGITAALSLVIGLVAIFALRAVVAAKDEVISVNAQNITDAERLGVASARRVAPAPGHFLPRPELNLEEIRENREAFLSILARLREHVHDLEGRRLLDNIEKQELDYRAATER